MVQLIIDQNRNSNKVKQEHLYINDPFKCVADEANCGV